MSNGGQLEDPTGGITASGRFARMESALDRIEEKLDATASKVELILLQTRVDTLEDTEQDRKTSARVLAENVTSTAKRVESKADARYRWTQITIAAMSLALGILGAFRIADLLK